MTASNFDAALGVTLVYEGGFSDNPHDPGGATNLGITGRTLAAWRGHSVTSADVKALTRAEAAAIYRKQYWDAIDGDSLPSGVDLSVWDAGVNSGAGAAKKWLTRATRATPVETIHAFAAVRLSFLEALKTWRYFGAGWGRRVAGIEALSVKWALAENPAGPSILVSKSREATAKAATAEKATTAPAAGGGAIATAHATAGGNIGVTVAIVAVCVVAVAALAFYSWRQSQRADAFATVAARAT